MEDPAKHIYGLEVVRLHNISSTYEYNICIGCRDTQSFVTSSTMEYRVSVYMHLAWCSTPPMHLSV